MAQNVREAVSTWEDSTVVVLVGNVHASKAFGAFFDPKYEPMGYLLREVGALSLNIRSAGGTAWVCTGPKPTEVACGASERSPSSKPDRRGQIEFGGEDPTMYDGTYNIGRISASPPKVTVSGG